MKRLCVTVSDEQAAKLKARQQEYGVPVSEQVRRAISEALDAPQPRLFPKPVLVAQR